MTRESVGARLWRTEFERIYRLSEKVSRPVRSA
jgi:hypothetical protein